MTAIPPLRIRTANDQPAGGGRYVLYWMIGARRAQWNFALEHAVGEARARGLGLVVFEPLRADYPWASARFHRFVIDGMAGIVLSDEIAAVCRICKGGGDATADRDWIERALPLGPRKL